MKTLLPIGLLVEGNATASTMLHLPGLADQIGPVKSTTLRVARRFSNALHAGGAVATYEELQDSRLVLVRAPDEAMQRIVEEIHNSELVLRRMCFAICETWVSSDRFSSLREAGAFIATLVLMPGADSCWFVAEGDLPAVRQVRRLVETSGGRVLQLRRGSKSLYFGAELLAASMPLPTLSAAQTCLRQSGLSGKLLAAAVDRLAQKLLRNLKAGARAPLVGPITACSEETSASYLADLRAKQPRITSLIDQHLLLVHDKKEKS